MLGLVGEKVGMTQVYDEDGSFVPVTIVRVCPNVVTAIRTKEKNGYDAIQLGYKNQKEKRLNKPQVGFFKKNKLNPVSVLKEFRTDKAVDFKVGAEVSVSSFQKDDVIDIQGTSKGKGFQGVMKRWGFGGGPDSHGASVSHRVPGSIGQRSYPGRVFPGKKLPGHMGDRTVTTKNLKVVGIEAEQNLLLVKGSVPGAKNSIVYIYSHAQGFVDRLLGSKENQESDQEKQSA